jgi:hypothetical protein
VCEGRRAALVAPLGSLAVAPAALVAFDALPPGLRDRTVDAMTEGAASGTDGLEPWGEDGFPPVPEDGDVDPEDAAGDDADPAEPPLPTGADPPNAPAMAGTRRARRAFVVLAIAVVLLLAAGAGLVLATDDGTPTAAPTRAAPGDEGDAPTDDEATTTEVRSGSTATTRPLTDATEPSGDDGAPATSDPDLTDAPTTTTTPPATGAPTTTVVAAPAPAPTTVPNAPPSIGTPVRSGSATMQTTCNPANDTRTISVAATDDRGIDRVVLRWSHSVLGAGERTMVRSAASTWQATLGPFAEPGAITFRAVAVDTDGASTASGTSSVAVDPCPG